MISVKIWMIKIKGVIVARHVCLVLVYRMNGFVLQDSVLSGVGIEVVLIPS